MSLDYESKPKKKRSKNADFWRAVWFLGPYKKIVTISVIAAFFVGLVFTTGLSAMLPIVKVLIDGYTVQGWVDRLIIEQRLGVKFADDLENIRVVRVNPNGYAATVGVKVGDLIASNNSNRTPFGDVSIFPLLADPDAPPSVQGTLPRIPTHLALLRRVAQHLPTNPIGAIASVFGILASLAILGNIIRYFQEHLSDKAAIYATNDIRRKLYDHVLHIPLGYFGLKGTSDVTSRLVQDSQGLQDGFKIILGQSIQEPIKAAFTFALALWINWQLTLCIVVFAPLMAAVIKKFGKKMRRANRAALQRSASMLGQIEGTLIGIRVVKGANAERFERRRYGKIMDQLVDEQLKMSRYEAMSTPAMETVSLLVVGVVLLIASYMVLISHSLDSASFLMVMACMVGIGESLRRVSKLNNVLQRSNAAAARIFETLDVPVERPRHLEAIATRARMNLPAIQKEICFERVSFAYLGASTNALEDVSLSVPKGQCVAVVGRNGSGKTTLLATLPRFYEPNSGRVMIDGVDIKNVTLSSLRKQISIVTQDSVIFPGSIAENIAYGLPLASRADIESAARRAFAHDFIMEKSEGYDTSLDGLGGQLSGGQKQRINIARAILRQSPILILDEATSQVDAESEHLIQKAINSLIHERTTFVIAHRFSTILSADTIVVMDRGKIVGQGRHEELLKTCPTYTQLYERQLFNGPPTAGDEAAA